MSTSTFFRLCSRAPRTRTKAVRSRSASGAPGLGSVFMSELPTSARSPLFATGAERPSPPAGPVVPGSAPGAYDRYATGPLDQDAQTGELGQVAERRYLTARALERVQRDLTFRQLIFGTVT